MDVNIDSVRTVDLTIEKRPRAAVMLTVITTCRLNDVDPKAWLADVFARIADLPVSRLHELLPWEMEGTKDRYCGGRVNSCRNNASERSKPSSVNTNDFDLLTGSPIMPFL